MNRTKRRSPLQSNKYDILSTINRNNKRAFLPTKNQGAPFCSMLSGSLTLEMAMIFPIFLSIMLFFLCFFQVLEVQLGVDNALGDTAIELSSFRQSNEITANALFRSKIEKENLPISTNSIQFWPEGEKEDVLNIKVTYSMPIPFSYFKVKDVQLIQRIKVKKFTGWEEDDQGEYEEERWVYVTKYGQVYHTRRDCRHLKITIQKGLLSEIGQQRNCNGQRYKPCEYCGKKTGTWIYYTPQGTSYHSSTKCSGLIRDVRRITISDAKKKGYRPCQDCGVNSGSTK